MGSRFVRKVRTASGAVAVQIVEKPGREVVTVEHVGSAHSDSELALLLAAADERLRPGQGMLEPVLVEPVPVSLNDVADWTRQARVPARGGTSWAGRPEHCVSAAAVCAGPRKTGCGPVRNVGEPPMPAGDVEVVPDQVEKVAFPLPPPRKLDTT